MRRPARATPPRPSRGFRAVRLTLNLEAKVDEALRALREGRVVAREVAARRAAEAIEARRAATRQRIEDLVDLAFDAEPANDMNSAEFEDALDDRLDNDEAYRDFEDRPIDETVRRLCADLGLSPDWSRWAGDGWIAELVPGSRPASSPFNRPSCKPLFDLDGNGPTYAMPAASAPHHTVRRE